MSQFYQLMPNETLIFEENNVHKGQNTGIYSDTLILTTVNIVHISSKGLFGRKANVTVMPLKEMADKYISYRTLLGYNVSVL